MNRYLKSATLKTLLGRYAGIVLFAFALSACGGGNKNETGATDTSAKPAPPMSALNAAPPVATKSAKRGIAYGFQSQADITALAGGISWWYNWALKPDAAVSNSSQNLNLDFTAMAWGGTPTVDGLLKDIPASVRYLSGFNEPNFKSQANMTPSQAAALWPVVQEVAKRRGLQLGAPVSNYCPTADCVSDKGVTYSDPIAYLDAFLIACKDCQIDYIPVHWYACNVDALKFIIGRYKKYQKPLWVTEFACGDDPHNTITLDKQKKYMTDAVAYLESEPSVARYAWFSGRNAQIPYINLLAADGQLTELGSLYLSLPFNTDSAATELELKPVAATASGSERADLGADKAIDKNNTTRWSSAFNDQQWLTLDFGSPVKVTRLLIKWENAHADSYQIQTSNDGTAWNTVKTISGSQGGDENISGLTGSGRYLRINGIKRSSAYGYSIFEIQAWTQTASLPTDPGNPTNPGDPSNGNTTPGAAVKPVAATSSATEGNNLSASNVIDGKANTRWASAADDGAWIQFDFGSKTQLGYMKLVWENAYAKEYKLQVSDDGQNWSQVRYVSNGQGGTEEFFNLGINARYVRMQGVARATQYGYSLFEVEFKSPSSDNSLPNLNTSALKYPTNGNGWAPLPAAAEPLETLQFSLTDGTLVTRFGARGLARHGRERGEDWNEIGYGPNETVDPVTGLAVDKGPGNYLTFVPQYFKNRTWGVEIIDNSRVAGVSKPTLIVNQYTTVDFLSGGIAFFRAIDRPGVTGYGWMAPGELVDRSVAVCKPIAYPTNGKLTNANGINGACTLLIKDYPGHGDLDANGFPNGKDIKARPLLAGDIIEVSPSMFSTTESMTAKGDTGGIRYYSYEWTYVVGTGLRPWYGVQPRLNSVPLPDDTLSGGLGSISYNYSDNGLFMFQQPFNNIGMQNMQRFVEGRRLIHTNFSTGDHNEAGNDRYLQAVGLQGQRYNQSACIACHVNNGRSPAPTAINQKLDSMSVRVASTNTAGLQVPHPQYGTSVQMNAVSATGTPQNWGNSVNVGGFDTRTVKLADGSVVELRKPTLAFEGAVPDVFSLRAAQPMIGTGLLEALAESDILSRVRSAPDTDGVKGQANYVYDPETGTVRLGRFGWKASKATLRHQAAEALLLDMAVTSPVYPNRACNTGPVACAAGGAQKGITDSDLQAISRYLSLVGVPAQRSLASGFPKGVAPLDEHRVDQQQVSAGAALFQGMRCSACHTVEMKTGSGHLFAELRNQTIRPYTDLLLHDMGTGLADSFVEGQAKGSMWRTAPLWGIGYTEKVMGNSAKVGYLHDGRARNLTEAILWHGGEAERARQRFESLSKSERDAVLAFLKSL